MTGEGIDDEFRYAFLKMSGGLHEGGIHGDAVSIATSGVSGIISSSPSVVVQRVDSDIPTWSLTAADTLDETKDSHPYMDISTESFLADDPLKQIEVLNSDQSKHFDNNDPIQNMLTDDNPMLSGGSLNESANDFLLDNELPLVRSVFDSSGTSLSTNNPFVDESGSLLHEGSLDNVMKDHNYVNFGDEMGMKTERDSGRSGTRVATRSMNQRRNVRGQGSEVVKRELRSSGRNQKESATTTTTTRSTGRSPNSRDNQPSKRASRGEKANQSGSETETRRTLRSYGRVKTDDKTVSKARPSEDSEEEVEGKSLKKIQEEIRKHKTKKGSDVEEKHKEEIRHQKVRRSSSSEKHLKEEFSPRERRYSEGEKHRLERQHSHGNKPDQNKEHETYSTQHVKHGEHDRHKEHTKHDPHKPKEHNEHGRRRLSSMSDEPILFTPDVVMKSLKDPHVDDKDTKHETVKRVGERSKSEEVRQDSVKHDGHTPDPKHDGKPQDSKHDDDSKDAKHDVHDRDQKHDGNPRDSKHDSSSKDSKHDTEDQESPQDEDANKKDAVKEKSRETKDSQDDDVDSEISLTYSDDENDSDWCSEDDPDRLWCICRQPHDNRFMISCDKCSEWYHGHCVGVTKRQGKEMERTGDRYVCPPCVEKDKKGKDPQHPGHHDEGQTKTSDDAVKKKKIKIFKKPVPKQHCIGSNCEHWAKPNTVYCSDECIARHVRESLRIIERDREKTLGVKSRQENKSQPANLKLKRSDAVAVVERHTGKVVAGLTAPTVENLLSWITNHSTYEVLRPGTQHSYDVSAAAAREKEREREKKEKKEKKEREERDRREREREDQERRDREKREKEKKTRDKEKRRDRKEKEYEHSKSSMALKQAQDSLSVRQNVRKTLKDLLIERSKGAKDIKVNQDEIEKVVNRIEYYLFKLFQDTGQRYKARYRTLIFNLKDTKNRGLFRRVLNGDIAPSKLVKMSSEQLASRELCEWREREAKHTLEMIKAEEEAKQQAMVHITKKTHKGEIEIEEDSLSNLEAPPEKAQPEKNQPSDHVTTMLTDTTDQHRTHLFDLNCKICTGKIAPPIDEPIKRPKVVVGTPAKSSSGQDGSSVKSEENSASSSTMIESPHHSMSKEIISISPELMSSSPAEEPYKPSPTSMSVWKGFVSMQNLAKFVSIAYRVSGPTEHLITDLPDTIHLCGRISFEQVWDYIGKIRNSATKDICVIRLQAATQDEKMSYITLYSYFNSRKRCGVVGNNTRHVKDMYLIPLASHDRIPSVLKPFDGPGLEEPRPHMLLGVIIRQRRHRHSLPSESLPISPRPHKRRHTIDLDAGPSSKRRISEDDRNESPPLSSVTEECVLKEREEEIRRKAQRAHKVFISEEQFNDPIVRQYANADPSTLVATGNTMEEAYSPGQEYEAEEEAKPYDPTDDVMDEVSDDDVSDIMDVSQNSPTIQDAGIGLGEEAIPGSGSVIGASGRTLPGVGVSSASQSSVGVTSESESELTAVTADPKLSEQQEKLESLAKELEMAKKALLETQIQNLQADISRTSSTLVSVASQALETKDVKEGTSKIETIVSSSSKRMTASDDAEKSMSSEDDQLITIPGLGFDTSSSSQSFLSPPQDFLSPKHVHQDAAASVDGSSWSVPSQPTTSSHSDQGHESAIRRSSSEGSSSSHRDSSDRDRGQTFTSFDDRPFVRYEYDKDGRRIKKDSGERHERERDRSHRDYDRDRERDRDRDRDRSRGWGRDERRWQESRGSSSHRSHDRDSRDRHDRDRWRQSKDRHRR